MSVLVIDYGMSNLGSICRALEECGGDVWVSASPDDLAQSSHVVLPGVGAFRDGMSNLKNRGWLEPLRKLKEDKSKPLLGICLGAQLLANRGDEGGSSPGLGIIRGEVTRIIPGPGERVPHVGWNSTHFVRLHPIFEKITDLSDFYFVHSYCFQNVAEEEVIARTEFGGGFASVVGLDNVVGVQFHPEKSVPLGLRLLKNFLGWDGAVPC